MFDRPRARNCACIALCRMAMVITSDVGQDHVRWWQGAVNGRVRLAADDDLARIGQTRQAGHPGGRGYQRAGMSGSRVIEIG
jgi:hypothetical protein